METAEKTLDSTEKGAVSMSPSTPLLARLGKRRAMYFIPWAASRMATSQDQSLSVADLVREYDAANAHALAEERSDDSQQRVVGGLNQEG